MERIASGCYVIDRDYNVVLVNDTAKAIYPQLEVGKKCYRSLMGLDAPCDLCPVAAGRKGPCLYTDPIRHISETVDAVEMNVDGRGLCYALVFATVGADAEYAATLPASMEELRDLAIVKALCAEYEDVFALNLTTGGIMAYRHKGKSIEADSEYRKTVPYEEGLRTYAEKYVLPQERAAFLEQNGLDAIRARLSREESYLVHYRVTVNDQMHYYYRKIARIGSADCFDNIIIGVGCEDGQIENYQTRLQLERRLTDIRYDSLTGLNTKEAMLVHGAELLEAFPETGFDFCVSKLENLDVINHQYGRLAGDNVLALIGRHLKTREAVNNCIAYLGDGVFASFTPNDPPETRKAAVMAFRDEVIAECDIKSISLKWSIYTNVRRDLPILEIMRKTTYALSTILMDPGRDYVEFDQSMVDSMEWEETVIDSFDEALRGGEFVVWYQPKYYADNGRIAGAEALARWVRADGRMVQPGDFIPTLEKYGRIYNLDEYMFREVCNFQRILKNMGIGSVPISVNLSRASMFRNDLPEIFARITEEFGIDRADIPIEITESAAVRAVSIRSFADRLIERGFKLHMDDFGTGYSSLVSLQILPFESIKLDKSLVDYIGASVNDSLLRHTIAFARESGKSIVAEGVEQEDQLHFLQTAGCDMIQGYYFSKPMSEKDFLALLLTERGEL